MDIIYFHSLHSINDVTSLDELLLGGKSLTPGAHSFSNRTDSLPFVGNNAACFQEIHCFLQALLRLRLAKPGANQPHHKESLMRAIQESMTNQTALSVNNEVTTPNITFAMAVVGMLAAHVTMDDCKYHASVPMPHRKKTDSDATMSLRMNKEAILAHLCAIDEEAYNALFPENRRQAFLMMDLKTTYDQFRSIVSKKDRGVAGTYAHLNALAKNGKKPMWVHHFFLLQTIFSKRVMTIEELEKIHTTDDFKWEDYFTFNWSRVGAGSRLLWKGVYEDTNNE